MPTYHKFSEEKLNKAVELLKSHPSVAARAKGNAIDLSGPGHLRVTAECITVSIENGQVCIDLPIVGKKCIPIPLPFPSGTSAQACIDLCYHVVPTGVTVYVSVNGQVVAQQSFGWC